MTIEELIKLAESGDAECRHSLAMLYYSGEHVSKDTSKALEWLNKAAKQNHVEAQYNLGVIYYTGEIVPRDIGKSIGWFEKAAKLGCLNSQLNLGTFYYEGEGVSKDLKKSFEYFLLAAEQGQVDAQFKTGYSYSQGIGVRRDEAKASEWYEKSAENGNLTAQLSIADRYEKGIGVTRDYSKSAYWFLKAAEQGDPKAQGKMGMLYNDGKGVAEDLELSLEWLKKAAEQGETHAKELIPLIQRKIELCELERKIAEGGSDVEYCGGNAEYSMYESGYVKNTNLFKTIGRWMLEIFAWLSFFVIAACAVVIVRDIVSSNFFLRGVQNQINLWAVIPVVTLLLNAVIGGILFVKRDEDYRIFKATKILYYSYAFIVAIVTVIGVIFVVVLISVLKGMIEESGSSVGGNSSAQTGKLSVGGHQVGDYEYDPNYGAQGKMTVSPYGDRYKTDVKIKTTYDMGHYTEVVDYNGNKYKIKK